MRKFVFGPIKSRRLGRSLGVDLVTPKTCPLDCIYCEARATTDLTMERREYVPVKEVLAELEATLSEIEMPDFIHVVREVTGIRAYSNAAMSRSFPGEDAV